MVQSGVSWSSRLKDISINLLLTLVSLALTMLVLEICFRLMGIQGEFHQPQKDNLQISSFPKFQSPLPFGFYPYSRMRSTYDSNPRGYFDSTNSIEHRFNAVGWRDSEHSLDKPSGTFRILGLGDSFLFGQGVKQPDVCLKKLETLLAEDLPEKNIETINAGNSGLNTNDQLNLLKARGLQYHPDLVIVHFVLNDVEIDKWTLPRPRPDFSPPDWLSGKSQLWGWSRQRLGRFIYGRSYVRDYLSAFNKDSPEWKRCQSAIREIEKLCNQHNVQLLFVLFPFFVELDGSYPFQQAHDTVHHFCKSMEIDILDLRNHYSNFSGPELWVHPTDQHPNELAHDIAAQAIAQHLRKSMR